MPMVTRVRNALRRLVADYDPSGSDDEEQDRSSGKPGSDSRRRQQIIGNASLRLRELSEVLSQCHRDLLKRRGSIFVNEALIWNSTQSKKSERTKIFFRSTKQDSKKASVSSDENSSSSNGSLEEGAVEGKDDGEPPLRGLLGIEHPTDETPSLDTAAADIDSTDGQDATGRVRSFPHVPGNWSTFVYILPRIDGLVSLFHQLYAEAARISDLGSIKWTLIDEPHISLSRTVTLRYHEIPQFTAHLKSEIKKASLPRIGYSFEDVEIYTNDQANTTFLALKVGRGRNELATLTKITDGCLKAFNMPPFYEKPEFHVSFAWCSGNVGEAEKHKIVCALRKRLEGLHSQIGDDMVQCAKTVHCRSGNRSYLMPL